MRLWQWGAGAVNERRVWGASSWLVLPLIAVIVIARVAWLMKKPTPAVRCAAQDAGWLQALVAMLYKGYLRNVT